MQIATSAAHIAAQTAAGIQRPQATPRRVETGDFVDLSPKTPAARRPEMKPAVSPTFAPAAGVADGAGRREAPLVRTEARTARPGSLLDIKV